MTLTFSGYPDVLDPYVLTDISTKNTGHAIYGIHIGSTLAEAAAILDKNGFKPIHSLNKSKDTVFKRGRLQILFEQINQSKIIEIHIHLDSTNKKQVIF